VFQDLSCTSSCGDLCDNKGLCGCPLANMAVDKDAWVRGEYQSIISTFHRDDTPVFDSWLHHSV